MTARVSVVTLALVVVLVLQTAIFPHLTIAGFRPDLLLLITVAFALRDGPMVGARIGFAAGLLTDLFLGLSVVGITAIVYTGVGYAVGVARPYLSDESFSAPMVLAAITAVIGTTGTGVLALLLGDERFTIELLVQSSLAVALYNTILAPVAVSAVTRLSRRYPIASAVRSL